MEPSIGRIVHVERVGEGQPSFANHQKVAPAIVTAYFGPTEGNLINCRVTEDGPAVPAWFTSIPEKGKQPDGYSGPVWFWPPVG